MILSDRDPEGFETELLHKHVDFSGKRVLEIGCGDGRITRRYATVASQVMAVDLVEEPLHRAVTSSDPFPNYVNFMQADATTLPYPPRAFDHTLLAWSL